MDERAKYIRKVAEMLRSRADRILEVEVMDTGNTIAKNLHRTIREPYGVVGRIIPFNHPIKFAANAPSAPLTADFKTMRKPAHSANDLSCTPPSRKIW